MTIRELREALKEQGENYIELEINRYKYPNYHEIHCDYLESCDENGSYYDFPNGDTLKPIYYDDIEVLEWYLMDEEDYSHTLLANSCVFFQDMYGEDDIILVIIVE